jgi:hypothetical protein
VTGNGNVGRRNESGLLFTIVLVSYALGVLQRVVFVDCINMTTDERTIFAKLEALKEIR